MQEVKESNVHINTEDCLCTHKPTPCDWVGNEMHYACLNKQQTAPQKVYDKLQRGGIGQIIQEKSPK